MNWGSSAEFLAMGGYAFYVWGSYLAALACMTLEPLLLALRRKRALERLQAERTRHETAA